MSRGAPRTTRKAVFDAPIDVLALFGCFAAPVAGNSAGLRALGQTYGVDTNLLRKAVGVAAGFAAADFRYWTVTVAVEVVRPNSFVALSV
jgi:hypothetical protein